MKKTKKKIFKTILFFIFVIALFFIFVNKRTIKLVSKYIEYYDYKSKISFLESENQSYNETLYLLKNKPQYIQKIAKSKLNLVEKDEIVYIVENNEKDIK